MLGSDQLRMHYGMPVGTALPRQGLSWIKSFRLPLCFVPLAKSPLGMSSLPFHAAPILPVKGVGRQQGRGSRLSPGRARRLQAFYDDYVGCDREGAGVLAPDATPEPTLVP